MPLIDPKKTISPYIEYSGPVIPNYNFSNASYETLGSSDTALGKMFGKYYDANFIPEYSQTNQRYYNQGTWTAHTNNLLKLAGAVPSGLMSLANVATSLPVSLLTWTSPTEVMERNPINQLYNSYKGFLSGALPSFTRDDFNHLPAFAQLTRPGELFSGSNESLQFLVEMMAGSYAIAPLRVGDRVAPLISKYNPVKNILSPIKAPNLARTAERIDMGLTNAMLSTSESFLESRDSYEQAVAKLRNDRLQGINNFTDEEITHKASLAADNVFWQNMMTTSITNGTFLSLVKPWYKPLEVASRDSKLGIKFKDGQFVNKFADKSTSKFEKFLFDKGYTPGVVTKSLLSNIATEGLEESLQYSIQKVNELDDNLISDTSFIGSTSRYLKEIGSLEVLDLTDDDRLKSAMLGSIIGAGSVGIASAFKAGPVATAKSARERRDNHLKSLNSSYTDLVKANIFEKEEDVKVKITNKEGRFFKDEGQGEVEINPADFEALRGENDLPLEGGEFVVKGGFKFDAEGRPIPNAVSLAKLLESKSVHDELDEYIEQESLRNNADPIKLKLYRGRKMQDLAKTAFDAGVGELLLERLEQLKDSPEDLLQMGIDPSESFHIDYLISYTKQLETLWNTAQNSTSIPYNSKEENTLNSKRKDYIYSLGSRLLMLDEVYRDLDNDYNTTLNEFLSSYDTTKGDPTPMLEEIYEFYRNSGELETLFKERASLQSRFIESDFNQDVASEIKKTEEKIQKVLNKRVQNYSSKDVEKLSRNLTVQNLAKLANDQKVVAQNREKLGETMDKVLDTKNGFKNFKKIVKEKGAVRTIFDSNALNLIVNESLTKEAYDFYEERAILREDFKRRSASTSREFYSELIDRFVEYFEANVSREDGEEITSLALSLKQLIADIIRNDARLYPESVEKLTSLLLKINSAIESLEAPLKALTDQPETTIFMYETGESEVTEEEEQAIADYQTAEEIRKNISPFDSEKLIAELGIRISGGFTTPSEAELKEFVAMSFLEPYSRILASADYDGESISESYDDIVSVTFELNKLTALRDKVMAEKGSKILNAYNTAIEDLEKVLSGVKQNRANRELKNAKENFIYAKSTLDLALKLPHKISSEAMKGVMETSVSSPVIAALAFEDLYKMSHDEETALQLLDERANEISSSIEKILSPIFKGVYWAEITPDKMNKFVSSPLRLFKHFLDAVVAIDRFGSNFDNRNFKKFLTDFDLPALLDSVNAQSSSFVDRSSSVLNNEATEQLVSAFLELDAINRLRTQLNSTHNNLKTQTSLLANIDNTNRPAPSSGQERVISQFAKWINTPSKESNHVFENVAALKAPPGAGKSLVVTPVAMEVAGLTSAEIVTAASNDLAAQNIAKAVGNNTTNTIETLIELLETSTLDSKVRLIIVDELGPVSHVLIDKLSKAFAKYNQQNTARVPVKMLVIYDPNQVTLGYKDTFDIEAVGYSIPNTSPEAAKGDFTLQSTIQFTQNIYDLTPLSASYRSDVAEIVDLFSTFVGSSEPSNITTATSVDPLSDTKNIMGAFVETDNKNMVSILQRSRAQNPSRSRVIIVGTEARASSIQSELKGLGIEDVKVTTVDKVQGSTFDEVYVDIRKTDSPENLPNLYQYPVPYNKAMNTAISRAKDFVYVANITGNNKVDTSIPEKALINSKQKNVDRAALKEAKKAEVDLLKKLTGEVVPETAKTTPTPSSEITEEEERKLAEEMARVQAGPQFEAPEYDSELNLETKNIEAEAFASEEVEEEFNAEETATPSEPLPSTGISPEGITHVLFHPQNSAFSDVGTSKGVTVGDKVFLVKDTYVPSLKDGYKERIMVLRPEGNGVYRKIAVVADKDIPSLEAVFGIKTANLTPLKFAPAPGSNDFVENDTPLSPKDYYSFFIGEGSRPLTYHYDGELSNLDANATFGLWARTLLGEDWKSKIEGAENVKVEYKVFHTPKAIARYEDQIGKPFRVKPKVDVPYMIISNLKLIGDKDVMTPAYIRLSSNIVTDDTVFDVVSSSDNKPVPLTMKTLDTFTSLVEEFHGELQKHKGILPYSIHSLRMGEPFRNESGVVDLSFGGSPLYAFHTLVKVLADQYTSKSTTPISMFSSEKDGTFSEKVSEKFPEFDPSKVSDQLLLLAARIDSMQHFGDQYVREKNLVPAGASRQFNGHAQRVLDKLGLANFLISIPETENAPGVSPIILRDYESNFVNGSIKETLGGKKLLGPVTAIRKNISYNPLIKTTILTKLSKIVASTPPTSAKHILAKEILERNEVLDVHTQPLKLWQLKALLKAKTSGTYSDVSGGFGLRAPVVRYEKEEETISPQWNVQTTFTGVSPTALVLTTTQKVLEEEVKQPVKKNIEGYLFANAGKPLEELVKEVSSYPKEEIKKFQSLMGTSSVSEAVKNYIDSITSSSAVVSVSASLKRTIRNLSDTIKSFDSNVELLEEVYKDSNYWKEDSKTKFGPRDNVRLLIVLKMFPSVADSSYLYRMATKFAQNRWYNIPEYKKLIEANPDALKILQDLVDAASKVASARKIKVKAPKVTEDVEAAVEYIAETIGSKVRHIEKAEALPVEISTEWKQKLDSLVNEGEAVPVIAAHVRSNPDQAKVLGLPSKGSDNEIAEAAIIKVLETSNPERDMIRESLEDEIGEQLTDEEANALYLSLLPSNPSLIKRFFKKRGTEAFRIVNFSYMQNALGKENWGLFKNGVVYVARHEKTGKVGSKVIRHEVLHKVIWNYLNPLDRVKLFELAKQVYGNLPLVELEERIAEAFASKSYKDTSSFWNTLKDIFYKILRFFNFTYHHLNSIDEFLSSIDRAYYSSTPLNVDTVVERDMRISKDWRITDEEIIKQSPSYSPLDSYRLFEELMFSTFDEIYEKPKLEGGRLVSFDSAIEETFKSLVTTYENAEVLYPDDYREVREALRPILSKDGYTRKAILDIYFPSSREAEKLAVKIAEAKERLDNLTEAFSEFEDESDEAELLNRAVKEAQNELSILEETFEAELRDPATKLTGRVKHRLTNIKFLNKATPTRADFSVVYQLLVEALNQVDNGSLYDYMDEVLRRLRSKYSVRPGAPMQRSIGGATTAYLQQIFERIKSLDKPRAVVFRKDVNDFQEYAIISKDGSPVGNLTKHDLEGNTNFIAVPRRDEVQTLDEYAKELEQIHKIPYSEIADAYYLYEEINFLTGLLTSISSLVKAAPMTAAVKYNYGIMSELFYYARRSGKRHVMTSEISTYFNEYVKLRRTHDKLHGMNLFKDFLETLPPITSHGAEAFEKKVEAVNRFLNLIHMPLTRRIDTNVSPTMFESFYYTFYNSMFAMSEAYKMEPTAEEMVIYGESEFRTGRSIIDEETSLRESLAELLNGTSTMIDSNSYRRGDGKQAYLPRDASYQTSLAHSINTAFIAEASTKFDDLTISKSEGRVKLSTTAPHLANNTFVTGKTAIVKPGDKSPFVIRDYDSKKRANSNSAVMLRSEDRTNFYERNFNYGFLSAMARSNGNSYYQFLPNPSNNRTSIQMASVRYLGERERKEAFAQILKAELNRPKVENDKNHKARRTVITIPGVTSTHEQLSKMKFEAAVEQAYKEYNSHIAKQVEEVIIPYFKKDVYGKEVAISESSMLRVAKVLKIDTSKYVSRADLATKKAQKESNTLTEAEYNAFKEKFDTARYDVIKALMINFYSNFNIQQHQLAQLFYGDQAFYASKEDGTKRIQVSTASGDIPLVDSSYGLPPTSRVAVFEDPLHEVPIDLDNVRDDSFSETYKAFDGQGYVLPEFYEKMSQAYSIDAKLDITLKPVYSAKDSNGEPFQLKYSLIVLTDELVNHPAYAHLKKLRDKMRNFRDKDGNLAPIDQAVFNSAVKVGNPLKSNLSKFDTLDIKPDSVKSINNKFLRMQLNPAKDTDGTTSNPSQITAMINTNGLNTAAASKLYSLNSLVIEVGMKRVMKDLALNSKGHFTKASLEKLRKQLIKLTNGMAGAEDINDFLSYNVAGKAAISLDLPLLAKKLTASLASYISKNTVAYRFPGSKVVLQAEAGSSYNLQWKDKDGYTEVVLPDTYKEFLKEGDVFTMGKGDSVVAFRIPSTNLHSAITLKVKGFYPAPKGSKQNIIIAPSLIVYYHGSDYDIDTLFLMRKASHTGEDINLNNIVSKYVKHTPSPALDIKKGDVYSEDTIGDLPVAYYLEKVSNTILEAIEGLRNKRTPLETLEKMDEDYYTLLEYSQKFARNNIVHLFSETLRDIKNRTDLLTPISTVVVSNNKSELDTKFEEDFEKLIELLYDKKEITKMTKCK